MGFVCQLIRGMAAFEKVVIAEVTEKYHSTMCAGYALLFLSFAGSHPCVLLVPGMDAGVAGNDMHVPMFLNSIYQKC